MNFSNQTHPTIEVVAAKVQLWLNRNCQRHLAENGEIDAESLGEQLAWEFGINPLTANDFAADFARQMNGGI